MKNDLAKPMVRADLLQRLQTEPSWDVIVIGGGATGLGIAVDAASRGLSTVLLDAQDFSAGTSSRSTKLIHGGVRYLAQGNVSLVREALKERRILIDNAPQLVSAKPFIVPCYGFLEREYMRIGLGMYDGLAGHYGIGRTEWLSKAETLERLPGVKAEGLRGGVQFWDGQFDDARLVIALMRTAYQWGAVPLNYMNVSAMARGSDGITAVTATDVETGRQYTLEGKAIFNACGVWVDAIRRLVDPNASRLVRTSRGSHILVDLAFMPAAAGMLIAKTRDGRVLFAIPWHGQLLIGTTDVEQKDPSFRPEATEEEIDFIIETAAGYLARRIQRSDVKATFSGLRPLFDPAATGSAGSTAKVSREHAVIPEFGNLITVTGGKWTTYRKMAFDAIGAAVGLGLLPQRDCITETLRLSDDGTVDAARVETAALADPATADIEAFTRHARDFEGARTVEDVLHRRVRLGQLDAAVTTALAGRVRAALAAV